MTTFNRIILVTNVFTSLFINGALASPNKAYKRNAEATWKICTNLSIPRFTFNYPHTWYQIGPATPSYGGFRGILIMDDSVSENPYKTILRIEFHSQQFDLFRWAEENWKPNKWITVAGVKALYVHRISHEDGKGNQLDPPLYSIVVYFVDKGHNGTLDIEFSTPVTNKKEVKKFKKLLSSFKFID